MPRPRAEASRRTPLGGVLVVTFVAGTALNLSGLLAPSEVSVAFRPLRSQDSARLLELERGTTAGLRFDFYLHLREHVQASSLTIFRGGFVDPANALGLAGIPVVIEGYEADLRPDQAAALAERSVVSGTHRSGWEYFIVADADEREPGSYRLMRLDRQAYVASEARLAAMGVDWRGGS